MYFADYIQVNIKQIIPQVICYGLVRATAGGKQVIVK